MSYETFFGVSRINIAIALLIQKVESKDGGSSHWQNEFKTRMWMAACPIEATRWSSRFLSPSISDAEPKSSPVKRDWTPSIFSPDPAAASNSLRVRCYGDSNALGGRRMRHWMDHKRSRALSLLETLNNKHHALHILQLEMKTAVLKTHAKHAWWSIERQVRVHC